MFWGLIMEPERRYSQEVKRSFRITMAALDVSSSSEGEHAQVMCGYEGRNYLLCTLKNPDLLQCSLDLEFSAGSQVSFASNGKAHIHLTGYLVETDEDGLTLADMEEQEEEEYVEEEEREKVGKKKKQKKKAVEDGPPAKKAKISNGSVEEEEESDDPDFMEDEDDEEEGSDSEVEEEDSEDEEEAEEEEQPKKLKKQLQQEKLQKLNNDQKKPKKVQQEKKHKRTLEKGVIVEDLVEGTGPVAKPGRFVNVYYEGRLEKNNKLFDSTQKGPGFKFRLGSGEVIKAWDIALTGMKVGGKRKIICPPQTAYGVKGSPPAIPPNSTLVFTVELKKVN